MITVCPYHAVCRLVDGGDITHVVSLLGPNTPHLELGRLHPDRHLRLTFDDIPEPRDGFTPPTPENVEAILEFTRDWRPPAGMLIHCWAGISRSTAAAFATMCAHYPDHDEGEIAWELRRISPTATPNRLMVAYADDILGRRGRMVAAVDAIGRGAHAFEGTVFNWKPAA